MPGTNISEPNFEPIKGEISLEDICKYLNMGSKMPFEFKTQIEITETEPVLTIGPTELEEINHGKDSTEEINKKNKLNNLFIQNQFDTFRPSLSKSFGWIYHDFHFNNGRKAMSPFYEISDDEYGMILTDMKRKGELVEIPKTKTYCIKNRIKKETKKDLKIYNKELAELLFLSFLNSIKSNFDPRRINFDERILREEVNCLFFHLPCCSPLYMEGNNDGIKIKYSSPEYIFPLNREIISFEQNKIRLVLDYFKRFSEILDKSREFVDIQRRLEYLNPVRHRVYTPDDVGFHIYPIAKKIKDSKELSNYVENIRKRL